MTNIAATTSEPHKSAPLGKVASWLVRHRVPISSALFVALIVEDLILATPPKFGWWRDPSVPGYLGAAMVLIGLAIRSWAAGILPKGQDLATSGPYSLCRHPLYLGSFLMMVGFCVLIGYLHDYLVILGPIALIYYFTMRAEEHRVSQKYGPRWEAFRARTPMFVPWRPWQFEAAPWSAARWWKCREYRAVLCTLAGLAAAEMWRVLA